MSTKAFSLNGHISNVFSCIKILDFETRIFFSPSKKIHFLSGQGFCRAPPTLADMSDLGCFLVSLQKDFYFFTITVPWGDPKISVRICYIFLNFMQMLKCHFFTRLRKERQYRVQQRGHRVQQRDQSGGLGLHVLLSAGLLKHRHVRPWEPVNLRPAQGCIFHLLILKIQKS